MPTCDAVYRITPDGLWQGVSELKRELGNVLLFLNMDEYFGYCHRGLYRLARRRYDDIGMRLQELLAKERDASAVSEQTATYRELGDRLRRSGSRFWRLVTRIRFLLRGNMVQFLPEGGI